VERILVDRLGVKEVFVGFNYSFGHKGAGNPELLKQLGKKYNFAVNIISPVTLDGEVISSSLVRSALDAGDIEYASRLLGYCPTVGGIVVSGEKRGGAKMGFPTANLEFNSDLNIPATGVYAARVWIDEVSYKAVINIGRKPTFHEVYPVSIEAHLMNFTENIYGKYIKIDFLQKIRDERKFNSLEELVEQIKIDCNTADSIASQYC
jgi:riboflavin kinase/FMN adenylyltransferase